MKLQFLGAVRTVTGSMHRLEVNGAGILLDCGLFQGQRAEARERNAHLPFDPKSVGAAILSHAHIDHSGNIPSLVRDGFAGNLYTTAATRDLCAAMLRDSAHIQELDASYLNKKLEKRGEAPIAPLYTVIDAVNCLRSFVGLAYGRPIDVAPGARATFHDAGHILGSAITVLELEEAGKRLRLAYTGDLGASHQPIIRNPAIVQDVDALIIESTYGNRLHEAAGEAEARLEEIVNEAWKRGGKLIVPAFAVGRTQTLVFELHQLMLKRSIPSLPIYIDSPLAINVTEVFRLHPECYDTEASEFLADSGDPFGFSRLRYVRSTEESKELNFLREPAIIISASGMAEAGRILHHLKNNISDPRNTVLIVGYQAENTLGRKLQEKRPQVPILGEMLPLRARVETIDGYSAHADRDGLLNWVKAVRGERLRKVYVVHGEEAESQALAEALRALGGLEVVVPQPGETVELV